MWLQATGSLASLKPVRSISSQSSHCWIKTNKKKNADRQPFTHPSLPNPLLSYIGCRLDCQGEADVNCLKLFKENWEKSPLIQFEELISGDFSTVWAHTGYLTLFPGFTTHNTIVKLKSMERLWYIAMATWLSLMYDQIPRQIMWCLHRSLLPQLILLLPQRTTPAHPHTLSEALAHPRRRAVYQPRRAWGHGVPGLGTLPLSLSPRVLFHSSVSRNETLTDRFSHTKATEAASSGRRSSTPRTTFPRRGIRGADGITIWPTGVLLTVCEHTHPHTANILGCSRGTGSYNTMREVQIWGHSISY